MVDHSHDTTVTARRFVRCQTCNQACFTRTEEPRCPRCRTTMLVPSPSSHAPPVPPCLPRASQHGIGHAIQTSSGRFVVAPGPTPRTSCWKEAPKRVTEYEENMAESMRISLAVPHADRWCSSHPRWEDRVRHGRCPHCHTPFHDAPPTKEYCEACARPLRQEEGGGAFGAAEEEPRAEGTPLRSESPAAGEEEGGDDAGHVETIEPAFELDSESVMGRQQLLAAGEGEEEEGSRRANGRTSRSRKMARRHSLL